MEENKWCVYKHTNKINGKVYIGITSTAPKKRWGKNGNGYREQVFGRAIHKYGWNNFEHTILHNNLSQSDAEDYEINLIKLYHSNNVKYGYNRTYGGNANIPNEETKAKMRINHANVKGIYNSQYGVSPQQRMGQETFQQWLLQLKKSSKKGESHRCHGMHPKDFIGEKAWNESLKKASIRWNGDNNPNKINPRKGADTYWYGKHIPEEVKTKHRETRYKNGNCKINMEIAKNIRNMYENGITQNNIAKQYEISRGTVGDIIRNRIYKDISYNLDKVILTSKNNRSDNFTKLNKHSIVQLTENFILLNTFDSIKNAALDTNVSYRAICTNLQRNNKYLTGGYHWMYYEDYLNLHSNNINNI
jgi:predicted DNA-binding protein YlxM (UPF0122 family)